MALTIAAIVAMAANRVIGFEGGIPWHLPADLKRFAALTTTHTVLMGRKTFDSLPSRFRPLPRRHNIVVSRTPVESDRPDLIWISEPRRYLEECRQGLIELPTDRVWIIGGEAIYRATLELCDEIHVTELDTTFPGDTFFPEFESQFELKPNDDGADSEWLIPPAEPPSYRYRFLTYVRRGSEPNTS